MKCCKCLITNKNFSKEAFSCNLQSWLISDNDVLGKEKYNRMADSDNSHLIFHSIDNPTELYITVINIWKYNQYTLIIWIIFWRLQEQDIIVLQSEWKTLRTCCFSEKICLKKVFRPLEERSSVQWWHTYAF